MKELATYSIETDHVVLLAFRDGERRRVGVKKLAKYLGPADLAQVEAALHLRHSFIKSHMPKMVLTMAAGGLVALLAITGRPLANLWAPETDAPQTPPGTAVVRSLAEPTPSPVPTSPVPTVSPPATLQPIPKPRLQIAQNSKPKPKKARPARGVASQVAPSVVVALPVSPTTPDLSQAHPILPNLGQVLGESTGPNAPTPSPSPSSSPSPSPSSSPAPSGEETS
jgi:hypothetical protein